MVYPRIYKAVHQVVRTLSIGIRKNYKKELRAVREGAGDNEMEIIQDDDHYDGKEDLIFIKEVILIEDEEYAQWEGEEEMMPMLMAADQENQVKDTVKEMYAEPIKLQDLLGLMKVCTQAPYIVISGLYTN